MRDCKLPATAREFSAEQIVASLTATTRERLDSDGLVPRAN